MRMSQLAIPTVRQVDGHTLSHLHHVRTSTTSLVPILTPPISSISSSSSSGRGYYNKNSDDGEQYILMPNSQQIVVRSAQHGKKICDLIVDSTRVGGNGGEQGIHDLHHGDDCNDIRAVTLAWLPSPVPTSADGDHARNGEWVILAGCKNGMVHEWSVSDLSSFSFHVDSAGGNDLSVKQHHSGRVSRRSFQLVSNPTSSDDKSLAKKTALELMHLTCPSSSTDEYETPPSSYRGGKIMLYGLVTETTMVTAANKSTTTKKKKNASKNVASPSLSSTWLIRMEIPPFVVPPHSSTTLTHHHHHLLPIKTLLSVREVPPKAYYDATRQDKYVCLKTNDSLFGFLAIYRRRHVSRKKHMLEYMVDDNSEKEEITSMTDVFVVMCSTHGLAVYRDSITTNDINSGASQRPSLESSPPSPSSTKLVHFTKIMKSANTLIPEEDLIVTSLAISPGANDLALGRGGGQIDVLNDVFENVAEFLDRRKQFIVEKKMMNETNGDAASGEVAESDLLQELWQQHPEEVTIRRTVHWHAHPVRTLTFMSASSGVQSNANSYSVANPMSLLSGGEESVLVTWQLDRNFHRPSHFVARVGRGGIVHILTCRSSGKVIVFCSDNSVQCFHGSTYERDWAEFGLAAMALNGREEEKKRVAVDDDECRRDKRNPVIMVKDPITNIPMLTNLPGAPGMIHWYDPNLASVVGTLEVAPYNRVSRRDPSDPHVPEPTVTHLAVGQSGKDMVTVDTVWTENSTVGAARDLIGPKGNITRMNVVSSIKFWTHVESPTTLGKSSNYQRKRRNGDVPMSYELVASMSAPHGREGMVCALAMAPNGSVACTLSHEEDAFRIWAKKPNESVPSAGGTGGAATIIWKCLYVVKTPSGFANLLAKSANSSSVGRQLVAFSSDGTVLSVSYGPYVTLWDHSNVTLLTSISTMDNTAVPGSLSENIETVNFLPGQDDAMLLTTAHRIRVKSPFDGVKSYLGDDEWLFRADSIGNDSIVLGKDAFVSAVSILEWGEGIRGIGGHFAVSKTSKDRSKSIISIINRDRGGVMMLAGSDTPIRWQVDGEVQSLYVENHLGSVFQLLAVMKDCRMLSLSCGTDNHMKRKRLDALQNSKVRLDRSQAPILKLGNKVIDAEQSTVKRRKVSIMPQREFSSKKTYSGFEFPALSGKFTGAFIARSLCKTK